MTLTLSKKSGQLFCGVSFSLDVSDVSLWLNSGYAFLAAIEVNLCCVFSVHGMRKNMSIRLISGGVDFDPLVKVVSAKSLCYKAAVFLFVINNKYLVGRHFETVQIF